VVADPRHYEHGTVEFEDHPQVTPYAALEVTVPQPPNPQAAVQMGLSEDLREPPQNRFNFPTLFIGQCARIGAKSCDKLNGAGRHRDRR
jgi:hypothetical protein